MIRFGSVLPNWVGINWTHFVFEQASLLQQPSESVQVREQSNWS